MVIALAWLLLHVAGATAVAEVCVDLQGQQEEACSDAVLGGNLWALPQVGLAVLHPLAPCPVELIPVPIFMACPIALQTY